MYRINEGRNVVVCPTIDIINDKTLEYINAVTQVGGFTWDLIFRWRDAPERVLKRRAYVTDPVR